MNIIFLLIGISLLVALTFLGGFLWAVRSGQYEDDYVKRDGRWYFAKRVYSVLNSQVSS